MPNHSKLEQHANIPRIFLCIYLSTPLIDSDSIIFDILTDFVIIYAVYDTGKRTCLNNEIKSKYFFLFFLVVNSFLQKSQFSRIHIYKHAQINHNSTQLKSLKSLPKTTRHIRLDRIHISVPFCRRRKNFTAAMQFILTVKLSPVVHRYFTDVEHNASFRQTETARVKHLLFEIRMV